MGLAHKSFGPHRPFLRFWGISFIFRFLGYFGQFSGSGVILASFKVLGVFWSFLGFEVILFIFDFRGILVIFWVSGVFWLFYGFWKYLGNF